MEDETGISYLWYCCCTLGSTILLKKNSLPAIVNATTNGKTQEKEKHKGHIVGIHS